MWAHSVQAEWDTLGIIMTRKRNEHTDSWIKVVTILTIVGLVALSALAIYYFILQRITAIQDVLVQTRSMPLTKTQYRDRDREYVYGGRFNDHMPNRKRCCPMIPKKIGCLRTQIEEPHEIVRHRPCYTRPKHRRAHMRDRVDRLERNVTLLKKTQSQDEALKELQKRINELQNNRNY